MEAKHGKILGKMVGGPGSAEFRGVQRPVIFDCDGTVLDTEKLRSEVSFLLLAPFEVDVPEEDFAAWRDDYILRSSGRTFAKKMLPDTDAARMAAGLPPIAEVWAGGGTRHPWIAQARLALGLTEAPTSASIEEAKLEENDIVLRASSEACPGMRAAIEAMQAESIPFNLASTSSRSSLVASLEAAGMATYFAPLDERVHSAESDFSPPRPKPRPDVFLKAAISLGAEAPSCIAVEDSPNGVAAAARAGIGLIVGYVGGGHISDSQRESAAIGLLAGAEPSGRGADLVLAHADGLIGVVRAWRDGRLVLPARASAGGAAPWGEVKVWLP